MEGIVSDFKRMSVHDGPGIRTTMFLKGCPLRCKWCHNPENLTVKPTLSLTRKLCIGCGACAGVCPMGVHTVSGGSHTMDYDRCVACGKCAEACLPGALKLYGQPMTAEEAVAVLLEDRVFYARSGGGVTVSGGEPLLQYGFVAEVFALLRSRGIHTALDTCGEGDWSAFAALLPHTELFLFDVKHIDSAAHKAGTGADNKRILSNLRRLRQEGANVEIRTPVIPGWNDDPETLAAIGRLLAELEVERWRLLPYHSMAKSKYEAVGMDYPMPETDMPDTARMQTLRDSLKSIFPRTMLSGEVG